MNRTPEVGEFCRNARGQRVEVIRIGTPNKRVPHIHVKLPDGTIRLCREADLTEDAAS